MCLAVDGSAVHALDCDEAASLGASNFFQVAVPAYDPKAVVAVRSLGELLRGSLARQGKLLKDLQSENQLGEPAEPSFWIASSGRDHIPCRLSQSCSLNASDLLLVVTACC